MKRIAFLDYVRVFACFLVMLVHASENFYGAAGSTDMVGPQSFLQNEADRLWVSVYDGFSRMSVPLFMIVSAYLLAPMKKGQSCWQFYRKRFLRIMPPFVFFMVLYSTLPMLWGQIDGEQSLNDLSRIWLNFPALAGHFWFMYPLISLYLFIPVISPWLEKVSAKEERFFIGLFLISTCIPFLNRWFGEVWGQCFWNEYHMLWYFSGYLGYLVLAHYIRVHLTWGRSLRLRVGFLLMLVGSVFDTICQGAEMEKLLTGVPVVLANGKLDLPNAYSVTVDDKYGVSLAVEHLVARGRKNIYYIKDRDTDSAKSKRDGFLEAMRRHGLAFADHVLEAGETLASGMETVQALLAQGIVPDGIVCGEDLTAAGALKALLRAGLRVPGQVAVVGFNNSDYAHLCEPASLLASLCEGAKRGHRPDGHPRNTNPPQQKGPSIMAEQSFWDMLRTKRDSLTKSGIIVADYLMQHAEDAQYLSISSLAKACGVAEATIFRFCRALGFDGYNEMKIALAKATATAMPVSLKLEPGVDTQTLCTHAYNTAIEALNGTRSALDPESVDRAATLLQRARQVFFFGQGGSYILACDIWARFSMLSTKFRTAGDSHMQAIAASLMGPEDVVVFVSYSGATRDMMDTLHLARENGAKVILLTHYSDAPGAALADVVLLCGAKESPLDSGSMPVKLAVLFVANVLVLRYTLDNQELANLSLSRTSRALGSKLL